MKHTRRNAAVALVLLLAIVFGCMFAADRIQRGNGTIAVTEGWIETDVGNLMYKLYTPKTATAENPASGVLLLHGYQNDHETCAAYAIELARRSVQHNVLFLSVLLSRILSNTGDEIQIDDLQLARLLLYDHTTIINFFYQSLYAAVI